MPEEKMTVNNGKQKSTTKAKNKFNSELRQSRKTSESEWSCFRLFL